MSKLTKTVEINTDLRDLIQLKQLENQHCESIIKGLLEDHAYDKNPAEFMNSPIFKAYEKKAAEALFAFETAKTELEKMYTPEEFKDFDSFKWDLDYDTCTLVFTQQ